MKTKLWALLSLIIVCVALIGCTNNDFSITNQVDEKTSPADTLTLVTGITGNQGGGVANGLVKNGFNVRGLTRNTKSEEAQYWRDMGVEMVQGDFVDHASIKAALVGVDYLFINLQEQIPNYIDETKFLLDAADAAGVKHILYSSNRRSDPELPQSASKTEVELYLRSSGYSYTTVRFPQMMSNFMREREMGEMLRNGVKGRGVEGVAFAYYSPDDLGDVAAAAFADSTAWNGREINLAGDEMSDKDLAALISELSGVEIQYTPAPEEAEALWLANQGLTYDTVELKAEFPEMMNLREYFLANNYGDILKEMSTKPLPPAPEPRGRPR